MKIHIQLITSLLLIVYYATPSYAAEMEWVTSNNTHLIGQAFSAPSSQHLVVMIPSRQGFEAGYEQLAQQLVAQNVSVWQPDWFGSYLQIPSESNLNHLPLADMVDLLIQASKQGKKVHIMAFGRGAPIALNAWRAWQQQQPNNNQRGGLVLISPNLVSRTPDPGEAAEYLAVARATDAPVWIFQPQRSPYHPTLSTLARTLEEGGASVWLKTLVDMRDRFFYRADANGAEQAYAPHFAPEVANALALLAQDKQPHSWHPLPNHGAKEKTNANTGRLLSVQGTAGQIQLPDTAGKQQQLSALKGKVVLVNFWASWCPPCVHEMPSMQRLLAAEADKGFALVAVNLGESPEAIRAFAQQYQLSFPIWLDETQATAKSWKVFAYPTSYLIDRQGNLRYAITGGADWMNAELHDKVRELLTSP